MAERPLKILLVDDSEFILQRILHLLEGTNTPTEVKTATSVEEAENWIHIFDPSLVFLDINLPGKNGVQFLKDIRKMEKFDPIIVMLTNNTLSGYRHECLKAGADYFLDKAKDFGNIVDIVNDAAGKNKNTPV